MSVIQLRKAGVVNLSKESKTKNYELRVGWDESELIETVDIDIMVILADAKSKTLNPVDENFIFYGNLESKDGSVVHSGDNRTGAGEGWDEVISLHTDKLKTNVQTIPVIVNIHEGEMNGISFSMVKNLKIQIFDVDNQKAIAEYEPELDANVSACSSLVIGEIISRNGDFYYKALTNGSTKGLALVLKEYGIEAQY